MSDNDFDHDAMFLVAGVLAAQAYAQSQYNNRVNAYVARGFGINEANAIVRTWYTAYEPPRWSTGGWTLAAIGWAGCTVLMVVSAIQTGDGVGGALTTGLIVLGLLYARVRYCVDANQRSEQRAREARAWLQERGL
jgi:hypothetical protein